MAMRYLSVMSMVFVLLGYSVSSSAQAEEGIDGELSASGAETQEQASGIIVIREYTVVGNVPINYAMARSGSVEVGARVHRAHPNNVLQKTGVAIKVEPSGRSRSNTTFVDEDEIEGLLEAIDYLAGVTTAVSGFESFEVEYVTKSGFGVAVFNDDNGKILVSMTSGQLGGARANFEKESLQQLKKLIIAARAKLRQE